MLDLAADCHKATTILDSFRTEHGIIIPDAILKNAKGVAVLSVIKAGLGLSGRHGTGIVVARLADGSWSAPSAIVTTGFGVGHQLGAQLTDFVIVLNTDEAVASFTKPHNFTAGANLSIAAGPFGASVEAGGQINSEAAAPIYSYSRSQGLFAGASMEFGAISERKEVNAQAYGIDISAQQILEGFVPRPEYAMELYLALDMTVTPHEKESVPLAFKKEDEEEEQDVPLAKKGGAPSA
ncbi:hypothetical protein HDU99_005646 [Rhizoclosmatium hyalinum]|nr:hypothetical protein HDU99_005646 [Rhizoclosmatium hyalinum]